MDRFFSSVITGGVVSAIALAVACGSSSSRSGFEPDPTQNVIGTFADGGMLGTAVTTTSAARCSRQTSPCR